MPISPDFTPSLKKIERAEYKLAQLYNIMDQFIATSPYEIRVELHSSMHHLIARRVKPVPEGLTWELVEAVGHLRSALDKMLVAVVESNGRGTSGVGFPFGGTSKGTSEPFPSGRDLRKLEGRLTPDQLALVIAQRPYPGGDDMLWAINEIANEDKHRRDLVKATPEIQSKNIKFTGGVFIVRKYGVLVGSSNFNHLLKDPEAEKILVSYPDGPRQPHIDCIMNVNIIFAGSVSVHGKEIT